MPYGFYNNQSYREKQAEITKKLWKEGIYDSLRTPSITKRCANPYCKNSFQSKISDRKKFCIHKCAISVNNSIRTVALPKNELFDLYNSGLSMTDIAKQLKISTHKVAYWINKHEIKTRNISDAIYIKNNPDGDPFNITSINSNKKVELLALGIGLFLGEGCKTSHDKVSFSNSNSIIIKIFLNFLRKICCVRENKIKAELNIFNDRSYEDCLNYWIKVTQIPSDRFYKPQIRESKGGTYKNKSKYGTINVTVNNTKLLKQIKFWCEDYGQKFAEVAQW